ncbi:hypothetical protein [Frateuria soli]|uniref:hypothetical protein n=1 Tax=Frateuria soli TaxID=1542730 RepID=UPI001E5EB4B8|nr:hypothetical protein [Frateuria soli]UGB38919.1 hypothetical protein LQ771_03435 [Frateuria soli]
MATKLKRVQALAAQTPPIGRVDAAARRGGEGAGRKAPEPEPVALSFDLAQIRNVRLTVVSKGVVVTPPKPKQFVVELSFEVTNEAPGR